MRKLFKKKQIPGPDSEEEKRSIEVDKMMTDWYQNSDGRAGEIIKQHRKSGWRLVIVVLWFFLVVVSLGGISLYWLIEGKSFSISSPGEVITEPLLLDIKVPAQVDSGDEVKLTIIYQNVSKARLIDLNLTVLYPDNFVFLTSSPEDPYNFHRNYWRLPTLEPNSSRKLEITGQLLGSSGEEKSFGALIIYKQVNFHSTFKEEASAKCIIENSVLDVELLAPDNLLPNQDVEINVKVKNTSQVGLDKIRVKLSYPADMQISEISIPLVENRWLISELAPQEEQTLRILGTLHSKQAELKEFKAEVGLDEQGQFVIQNQAVHVAGVIDPKIEMQIERFAADQALLFGDPLQLEVVLTNLSTLVLEQGVLELEVSDNQDLIVWESFNILEDWRYEIVADETEEDSKQIIRFLNIPPINPAEEVMIKFSLGIIEVPYDINTEIYAVLFIPYFKAQSSDLSVPVMVQGNVFQFQVSPSS